MKNYGKTKTGYEIRDFDTKKEMLAWLAGHGYTTNNNGAVFQNGKHVGGWGHNPHQPWNLSIKPQ